MDNYNIISFKPEVIKEDLFILSPATLQIFSELCMFAKKNLLPVKITSIISDVVQNRVSSSHKEGRAIDISSRGWTSFQALELQDHLNFKFQHLGATSFSDGKVRACVWHDAGFGSHFHIQSSKSFF